MAERLKQTAKLRNISLNKLIFEFSTQALAEEDASTLPRHLTTRLV